MATTKMGCKKCGGVIEVQLDRSYDQITVRIRDGGKIEESFGEPLISCKKCGTRIAEVSIKKMR